MERDFQQEYSTDGSLAERVETIEKKLKLAKQKETSKERTKQFRFPFKWRRKFAQAKRKRMNEMMLVFFLNKKNEIESPKFMPIFDGNMIIWKNKPYEFDPRAVWRVRGMKGSPLAYLIKEIDRRPIRNKDGSYFYSRDAAISNQDLESIRVRGDSTESDEFLIKAALKAQTAVKKNAVNVAVIVIVALILIGGLIYLLAS